MILAFSIPGWNTSQAHLHLMVNHFPLVGLLIGWLLLVWAGLFRQRSVIGAAFWVITLCAAMTYPAVETGEHAEGRIFDQLDKQGEKWLGQHAERADKISIACYILAGLAVASDLIRRFKPKTETPIVWLMVIFTAATLAGTYWVADAGGKIRHPEIRHTQ